MILSARASIRETLRTTTSRPRRYTPAHGRDQRGVRKQGYPASPIYSNDNFLTRTLKAVAPECGAALIVHERAHVTAKTLRHRFLFTHVLTPSHFTSPPSRIPTIQTHLLAIPPRAPFHTGLDAGLLMAFTDTPRGAGRAPGDFPRARLETFRAPLATPMGARRWDSSVGIS
ncbi:hypothetical protein K488DRAFT_90311 [Vararia minispora EC-137]|uniref:Uncharacterized protein n=1 Tax=Vararia minispora EC-137 TaxID=1314806 RepID=A0ACB8Q867_9AGAM|nr:hypothetical protein K488DRAFT_90311 [Vararia minispora EC-137]